MESWKEGSSWKAEGQEAVKEGSQDRRSERGQFYTPPPPQPLAPRPQGGFWMRPEQVDEAWHHYCQHHGPLGSRVRGYWTYSYPHSDGRSLKIDALALATPVMAEFIRAVHRAKGGKRRFVAPAPPQAPSTQACLG